MQPCCFKSTSAKQVSGSIVLHFTLLEIALCRGVEGPGAARPDVIGANGVTAVIDLCVIMSLAHLLWC